jgi:hypothetical protein
LQITSQNLCVLIGFNLVLGVVVVASREGYGTQNLCVHNLCEQVKVICAFGSAPMKDNRNCFGQIYLRHHVPWYVFFKRTEASMFTTLPYNSLHANRRRKHTYWSRTQRHLCSQQYYTSLHANIRKTTLVWSFHFKRVISVANADFYALPIPKLHFGNFVL